MAEYYEVHCTNCGNVISAVEMGVDIQKPVLEYLKMMRDSRRDEFHTEAVIMFERLDLGLFFSVHDLMKGRYLREKGEMELTGDNLMDMLEQKYEITLRKVKKDSMKTEEEYGDQEDEYEENDDQDEIKEPEYIVQEDALDFIAEKLSIIESQEEITFQELRKALGKIVSLVLCNRSDYFLRSTCELKRVSDDRGSDYTLCKGFIFPNSKVLDISRMICPKCGREFYADAGRYKEHVVVMLGSSRVGKTAYLASIVNSLRVNYNKDAPASIKIISNDNPPYSSFLRSIVSVYRMGKKIEKTQTGDSVRVPLFSLGLNINDKNCIMTFVDMPGEVYVPEEGQEVNNQFISNKRRICRNASAYWLCIDPTQVDASLIDRNEKNDGGDKVESDIEKVLNNVRNSVSKMHEETHEETIPTAVILTKSDLMDAQYELYSKDKNEFPDCVKDKLYFNADILNGLAYRVKRYFESSSVKDIRGEVKTIFKSINYFAVASYGIEAKTDEKAELAPCGVLLPFTWTLTMLGYFSPYVTEFKYKTVSQGFFRRKIQVEQEVKKMVEKKELTDQEK